MLVISNMGKTFKIYCNASYMG